MNFEEVEKLLQRDDGEKAAAEARDVSSSQGQIYRELLDQGKAEFNQSSQQLHSIFKDTAAVLLKTDRLTESQAQRYYMSGSESNSALRTSVTGCFCADFATDLYWESAFVV